MDILIERADGTLAVWVRDDGADATRCSGLVGLCDRVEAVGGTMTLDSKAGAAPYWPCGSRHHRRSLTRADSGRLRRVQAGP